MDLSLKETKSPPESITDKQTVPPNENMSIKTLFLGGLLPVILFTLIEDNFGTYWGVIAALIYGVVEVGYEYFQTKKVSQITLFSNGLILILGLISLISEDGIWFKLQPAILEIVMSLILWGSVLLKKPLLLVLAQQQKINFPEVLLHEFKGLTSRLGFFFLIHCVIATWAAFKWTTTEWALLKGVGLTVSLILYMLAELFFIRKKLTK